MLQLLILYRLPSFLISPFFWRPAARSGRHAASADQKLSHKHGSATYAEVYSLGFIIHLPIWQP